MTKDLVSIVLPIYKTEKFLDRCITSIVNQTYSNLEIILVDDGSPDNCPAMCDAWAEKDSRIRVVHKENEGLGMARNTGIEKATGEYICFFDSDDYIALDTIESAYFLARKEKSDIVIFGLSNVDKGGNISSTIVPSTDKTTYSGHDVQNVFLPDLIATSRNSPSKNLYMSACVCMYSMKMIQSCGWRFASEREIISEDVYSLLCLYKHIDRVSVLPKACYFYCENGTSLTHVYRPDRFEKICHFHATSVSKARELGYSEEVIKRLQEPFILFSIAAMKMIMTADISVKEKKQAVSEILNSDYLRNFSWDKSITSNSSARELFVYGLRTNCFSLCWLLLKLKAR